MDKTRKITEAAGKMPDGTIFVAPRPGRHDVVVQMILAAGHPHAHNAVQGFVDDEGTFYTRTEALALVRETGQLKRNIIGSTLTSEDLWDSWRCGYDVDTRTHGHGCGHHYEVPMRPKRRLGQRINYKRSTTCPECGKVDALHPRRD